MAKCRSWEVSDAFWEKVQPLIPAPTRNPQKTYRRKSGGGRKPLSPRKVFEGIVYVLRTGCQWKALPQERFGSPSSVHQYFQKWHSQGFFLALWKVGLAEYDEMEGIAWEWQSIDGAMTKAPLAQESVGPNPTDRGKNGDQTSPVGRRAWNPVVARRNRSKPTRCHSTGTSAGLHGEQTA